jgi:hypothetical protein
MIIAYDPRRSVLFTPESQDTLFQDGQIYSPLQLAVEAARLAYYRAEESPAQMQRLTEALARAHFGAPVMFIDTAAGAAGFGSLRDADGVAVLALRGTQPDDISDIAHDLEANIVNWGETGGRVHAGFAAVTRALLPKIGQWIKDTHLDPGKLIVTGHSLGAAMATLVASVLRSQWLVTLGSPRVGDADFIATIKATNLRRIVDCCDAVTDVPPPLFGYTHLRTCTYLTRDAQVLQDPISSVIDADRMEARREYVMTFAWRMGAVLLRDLADHAPINYARAFFTSLESE